MKLGFLFFKKLVKRVVTRHSCTGGLVVIHIRGEGE